MCMIFLSLNTRLVRHVQYKMLFVRCPVRCGNGNLKRVEKPLFERIFPRTLDMNAHIEIFHSILEEECFRQNVFATYGEAYVGL